MNKQEIEAKIREKYDDEYTVKMFTNFVLEFQECFSDIMSTEEVIDRIKKNVYGNIRVVEEFSNKNLDGRYAEDSYIYFKKSTTENEGYTKYLLFHEMLHAVTAIKYENGNDRMLGFSYLKNSYGMGLNEAMTEYLTQIRNERFEPQNRKDLISDYRTIVEQMRRLISIIGDRDLKQSYFYNPENLKEILAQNNMNYDEIEWAFRNLTGQDYDVNAIANGKTLANNRNYCIQRHSETIFNNYSKAIGEVKTLEDFKRKYEIFQTRENSECDCKDAMLLTYYKNMGKDIDILLRSGVSLNEIKQVTSGLNLNINEVKVWYDFSKCFVQDKNESAIKIFEFYKKNPNIYFAMFARSYGMMFEHFAEYDYIPSEKVLYDGYRYPIFGAFLKDHQEIDYSEVSYDFWEERYSKNHMFIFKDSNGKRHGYNLKGEQAKKEIDSNGKESFEFRINDHLTGKFVYEADGRKSYSFNSSNDFDLEEFMKHLDIRIKEEYSIKEDIEYWIEQGQDTDGFLATVLDKINTRIKNKRNVDFIDV